jgi:hypothetical protein
VITGRFVTTAVVVGLLAGACTGGSLRGLVTPSPSGNAGHPTPPPSEANPLCRPAPPPTGPAPSGGSFPPAIAQVAGQVEQVRQLTFERPVTPEPLSQQEMQQQLRESLDQQFPADLVAREGQTLTTIGALPPGTDLRQALVDYGTSQIIGFYNSETKRLVFEGGAQPSPFERFTLAHELTHALQDQHFDLNRLDRLNDTCQDERAEAFLSLAEGDAVETQLLWARANLTADQFTELQREANSFPPPPPTPAFVEQSFLFPYPNGETFVEALLARGGEQAVDTAFRDPPVSTEQILHPDKYPGDVPQAVSIPDLSASLGQGWSLLDQEEVGEGWLRILLRLRLAHGDADDAAAGWDGGLLRAWSDGNQTAALIDTVWDSQRDAGEFAAAMRDWIGQQPAEVHQDGTRVQVLFASDAPTLATLSGAAPAP